MRSSVLCGCCLALAGLGVALGNQAGDRAERILKQFLDEFIMVTPGEGKFPASFVMGGGKTAPAAELPAHKVTFRRPFAMAKYEVTQELYQLIMGRNPSKWGGPRNSVELVSWDEAREFCRKATEELQRRKLLPAGESIRLPSEAEWCADAWHPSYEGAPADGSAREMADAKERVMRGGSWRDKADACRSGFRGHRPPEARSDAIGFRCVRVRS